MLRPIQLACVFLVVGDQSMVWTYVSMNSLPGGTANPGLADLSPEDVEAATAATTPQAPPSAAPAAHSDPGAERDGRTR